MCLKGEYFMYTLSQCKEDYDLTIESMAKLLKKSIPATKKYYSRYKDKSISVEIEAILTNSKIYMISREEKELIELLDILVDNSDKLDKQKVKAIIDLISYK